MLESKTVARDAMSLPVYVPSVVSLWANPKHGFNAPCISRRSFPYSVFPGEKIIHIIAGTIHFNSVNSFKHPQRNRREMVVNEKKNLELTFSGFIRAVGSILEQLKTETNQPQSCTFTTNPICTC